MQMPSDIRANFRTSIPWIIGGFALLLYLATLSRHYTADSLLYALAIEYGGLEYLIDPTHLLLHPVGWLWYQLWLVGGWAQGSLLPLEVLNALGGAVAVVTMFFVARRFSGLTIVGSIVATGFAFSGGLWLLSVEAEFVTIPLAFSMLVLAILLLVPESITTNRRYLVLLGLVTALAILSYASNFILVAVVVTGLSLQADISVRERRRKIMIFLSTVFILIIPIFAISLAFWTAGDATQLLGLFGEGVYGQLNLANIPNGLYAFLRTLFLFKGLAMNDSTEAFLAGASSDQRAGFAGYYLLAALIVTIPVLVALVNRKQLWTNNRSELIVLSVWSFLYAAFGFYWVPGDISFWMPLLVAWWLLVSLVLGVCLLQANHFRRLNYLVPVIVIAAMAISNAVMVLIPRRNIATNHHYQVASEISLQTQSGDMVMTDATRVESLYLAYFSHRLIVSVSNIHSVERSMANEVENQIRKVQAAGGKVFALRDDGLALIAP